ncbi:MAG TPA: hydrogenase assembly protein HupF [Candidatus Dormibacteraeota bacterium]
MTGECHDEVCITCSDQLLEVTVLSVDASTETARGIVDGTPVEVSVELIDSVRAGDVLLCHGGVALQRGTLAAVGG